MRASLKREHFNSVCRSFQPSTESFAAKTTSRCRKVVPRLSVTISICLNTKSCFRALPTSKRCSFHNKKPKAFNHGQKRHSNPTGHFFTSSSKAHPSSFICRHPMGYRVSIRNTLCSFSQLVISRSSCEATNGTTKKFCPTSNLSCAADPHDTENIPFSRELERMRDTVSFRK